MVNLALFSCVYATLSLCWSVCWSISLSISDTFASDAFLGVVGAAKAVLVGNVISGVLGEQFLHHCACPIAHDWVCRVYGLVQEILAISGISFTFRDYFGGVSWNFDCFLVTWLQ